MKVFLFWLNVFPKTTYSAALNIEVLSCNIRSSPLSITFIHLWPRIKHFQCKNEDKTLHKDKGFIAGLLHIDSEHVYLKQPHTDSSVDTASIVLSKLI